MRIQPGSQLSQPAPSVRPLYEDIVASKSLDELLFVLTKWMDVSVEEPVSGSLYFGIIIILKACAQIMLISWVLALNKIDDALNSILKEHGKYLVLPETPEEVAAPPAELKEILAKANYGLVIILRFLSMLLINATDKDTFISVEVRIIN